jgi:methyl-accepting chemotaxis protein
MRLGLRTSIAGGLTSIRTKTVALCLALTALTVMVGLQSLASQRQTSALGTRIYDEALMAVSYLRSAQNGLLRLRADIGDLAGGNNVAGPALIVSKEVPAILEDLAVARDRAMSAEGRTAAVTLERGLRALLSAAGSREITEALQKMQNGFDTAVEVYAGDGFRYRRDMLELMESSARQTLLLIVVSVVIGLVLALAFSSRLVTPLLRLTEAMTALAGGASDAQVPAATRSDEIGAMARALRILAGNEADARRITVAREREQQAKLDRAQRVDALCRTHDDTVARLSASVGGAAWEMLATSEQMISVVAETATRADAAAAATQSASVNVRAVADSTDAMSSSILEASHHTLRSAGIADRATEQATRADQSVQMLAGSAARIGDVVATISTIAAQTNLLALNATIEAARAGEAGRGFAVVASEVKALAVQTARATSEIGDQVEAIQRATNSVVEVISTLGATIAEMRTIAQAVARTMDSQGSVTRLIAGRTQEAAVSAGDITDNVAQVTASMAISDAAAQTVVRAATRMTKEVETLGAELVRFLDEVRAA